MTSRTGLAWHESFMWHDTSPLAGFLPSGRGVIEPDVPAENPATKRRIKNLLDVAGLTEILVPVTPRPATSDELCRVHECAYVAAIAAMSAGAGGDARLAFPYGEAPFGPGGFEIAALAAGAVIAAVDAVLAGRVRNAYALVRPPGHHAEPDHGLGFCIFNNGAVAARHALRAHGLGKVAIVDWDVHHGNGAERIFWDDPDVLTLSIHQDGAFPPKAGPMSALGGAAAEGRNLNIPLPPGSGTGAYFAAFERVVVPALHCFKPDLILVACGFDAGAYDPMARMMLHSDAFRTMTRHVREAAEALCGGRLVMCHEGGYHTTSVPFYGLAVMEELSGHRTAIADPFLPLVSGFAYQGLQPHQEAVLRQAEALLDRM